MREHELQHILDYHACGMRRFHYFRDRYALIVLALVVGRGRRIADLRGSPVDGLLRKPVVREVLAGLGGGSVSAEDLLAVRPRRAQSYVLTFGRWGTDVDWRRSWEQMSRRGFNLVLQLNLPDEHDRDFRNLLGPEHWLETESNFHPVNRDGRNTLAWARIDVDLRRRQALIEEVQSEWVWEASQVYAAAAERRPSDAIDWYRSHEFASERRIRVYYERVLAVHRRIWDEAVLTAALTFLVQELGIERVYYHTFETGCRFKMCGPPRSLYVDLPRRFAFGRTSTTPDFLIEDADQYVRRLLRRHVPSFHVHEWDREHVKHVSELL